MKPVRTIGLTLGLWAMLWVLPAVHGLWAMLWVLPAVHGELHAWRALGVPLLGSCPVDPSSRRINEDYIVGSAFNDKFAEIWMVVAGAGFAVLAMYALIRNSRRAAVSFLVLFLVSTFAALVRLVNSID